MTSALLAAMLLACAAAAAAAAASEGSGAAPFEPDGEDDAEGDVAPFMIVVVHGDGWRCSGSLVSLRTALTSAWCARGRGAVPARELWALAAAAPAAPAAAAPAARRVARLALAAGADAELAEGGDAGAGSWRGGAMDLAILELEEPFGAGAGTRPILMATAGAECEPGAACHVSRAEPRPGRLALRIEGAALAAPAVCAAAADHWLAVRDRALCLRGPKLCEGDWGGGVVCGGKLCGVLSRSVRAGAAAAAAAGADACGDTHAAQSVARWRRFLHCAHTLRACGRGGDCADLCIERRLIEEPEPEPVATAPPADETPAPTLPALSQRPTSVTTTISKPTRTGGAGPAAAPPPTPAPEPEPAPAPRLAFEFEPNRADFKLVVAAAPAAAARARRASSYSAACACALLLYTISDNDAGTNVQRCAPSERRLSPPCLRGPSGSRAASERLASD